MGVRDVATPKPQMNWLTHPPLAEPPPDWRKEAETQIVLRSLFTVDEECNLAPKLYTSQSTSTPDAQFNLPPNPKE